MGTASALSQTLCQKTPCPHGQLLPWPCIQPQVLPSCPQGDGCRSLQLEGEHRGQQSDEASAAFSWEKAMGTFCSESCWGEGSWPGIWLCPLTTKDKDLSQKDCPLT